MAQKMTFGGYVMFAENSTSRKYDLLLDHPLRGCFEQTNNCNIAELVRQYKNRCRREFWADHTSVIAPIVLLICMIAVMSAVHPYLQNDNQRLGMTLVLFLVLHILGQVLFRYVKKKVAGVSAPDVSPLDDFKKNIPTLAWTDFPHVNGKEDFQSILVHIAKKILCGEQEFNDLCGLQGSDSDKLDAIIFVGQEIRRNRAKYDKVEASAKTFGFLFAQGEIFLAARRQIAKMKKSAL